MIDLHTHILPEMDDGAGDLEESLGMIHALFEQKILSAVCTPHFDPTQMALEDFLDRRSAAITMMGTTEITLLSASETILHEYLFHYPDLSGLYIENTRYLLLELPFHKKWKETMFQTMIRLIDLYDCIPMIAHIERYPAATGRIIRRLLDLGCIIQLNTFSVINEKTRKKAIRLIRKGYIDVLGSDCHNMTSRPPIFISALTLIRESLGASYCEQLEVNSELVLKGLELR